MFVSYKLIVANVVDAFYFYNVNDWATIQPTKVYVIISISFPEPAILGKETKALG
jgi:hypothetical protein